MAQSMFGAIHLTRTGLIGSVQISGRSTAVPESATARRSCSGSRPTVAGSASGIRQGGGRGMAGIQRLARFRRPDDARRGMPQCVAWRRRAARATRGAVSGFTSREHQPSGPGREPVCRRTLAQNRVAVRRARLKNRRGVRAVHRHRELPEDHPIAKRRCIMAIGCGDDGVGPSLDEVHRWSMALLEALPMYRSQGAHNSIAHSAGVCCSHGPPLPAIQIRRCHNGSVTAPHRAPSRPHWSAASSWVQKRTATPATHRGRCSTTRLSVQYIVRWGRGGAARGAEVG